MERKYVVCYTPFFIVLIMLYDYRKDESVGEIVKGLICYFDKALPAMLLYKSERQQYEELIVHDVSPSSIYGAEHLLRLFGNTDYPGSYLHTLVCIICVVKGHN